MKRAILILTLLIMNAYAENCHRMSDDELRELESRIWKNYSELWNVNSGVRCDDARFIKVHRHEYDGCISDVGDTRDIILNGRHDIVIFDEFGMPAKNIDNVSKNASCEKLYIEFKSKVK